MVGTSVHVVVLCMPSAVIWLPAQPLANSNDNQQGPPAFVHALPIRVQRCITPPPPPQPQVFVSTIALPPPPPPSTPDVHIDANNGALPYPEVTEVEGPLPIPPPTSAPYPAYFLNNEHPMYDDAITFGSAPFIELGRPQHGEQFTELEEVFLHHVARYFKGRGEIERGIQIPEDFEEGAYLEAIGPEGRVSLQFPILESLFACAAIAWPDTPFSIFTRPPTMTTDNLQQSTEQYEHLSSPTLSSSDSVNSSSLGYDWQYPESPPSLPVLKLPISQLRTMINGQDEETMETQNTDGITEPASTRPNVILSPPYSLYSPSLSFDNVVKLKQEELDELPLLFHPLAEVPRK